MRASILRHILSFSHRNFSANTFRVYVSRIIIFYEHFGSSLHYYTLELCVHFILHSHIFQMLAQSASRSVSAYTHFLRLILFACLRTFSSYIVVNKHSIARITHEWMQMVLHPNILRLHFECSTLHAKPIKSNLLSAGFMPTQNPLWLKIELISIADTMDKWQVERYFIEREIIDRTFYFLCLFTGFDSSNWNG